MRLFITSNIILMLLMDRNQFYYNKNLKKYKFKYILYNFYQWGIMNYIKEQKKTTFLIKTIT